MMELVSQMVATRKMSTVCTFVYTIVQNSEDIGFNFTVGVLGYCIVRTPCTEGLSTVMVM